MLPLNNQLGSVTLTSLPRICVLLATYNGAKWLDAQLDSLVAQHGVEVRVIASDDSSSDETLAVLERRNSDLSIQLLPPAAKRFGNANRNFLRLMKDAEVGDAQFVALADQDDVWLPAKLLRAVQCLGEVPADGYSSNVTAFWPDGRQKLLRKSAPQRNYDFLFGSPGPGCTFVMTRTAFDRLRHWIAENFVSMQNVWVHDWLIYACIRAAGMRWHIDDQANMLYRQHGGNEIGANRGVRAALARYRHVRSGAYRRDILAIASVVRVQGRVVDAVERLSAIDRLWLVLHARSLRRRLSEALLLAILILCMPRETKP